MTLNKTINTKIILNTTVIVLLWFYKRMEFVKEEDVRPPRQCPGNGKCYRRYKKDFFDEYFKVDCSYNCILKKCDGCYIEAPEWYYDQYSSGKCYECNKVEYCDEIDSDEEAISCDASIDSPCDSDFEDDSDWITNNPKQLLKAFQNIVEEINKPVADEDDDEDNSEDDDDESELDSEDETFHRKIWDSESIEP